MSDNPDTIDTILDDMLNEGHTGPADSLEWIQAKMKFYAGRIKAAWKRQSVTGGHGLGNAAAMREALEKCRALAETIWQSEGGWDVSAEIAELKDLINAALAAPPRNCDVPHKDDHELWLRWQAYCAEIYPSMVSFSTWLLAPAQEGGAK